jgi:hypothetical protein
MQRHPFLARFAYTPAAGSIPAADIDSLSVTFTPTDTVNYSPVTATVQLAVSQAAPTLTWAVPASIIYGTALSATQLNAAASVLARSSTLLQVAVFRGRNRYAVGYLYSDGRDKLHLGNQDCVADCYTGCAGNHVGHSCEHYLRYGTLRHTTQRDGIRAWRSHVHHRGTPSWNTCYRPSLQRQYGLPCEHCFRIVLRLEHCPYHPAGLHIAGH